jgi:hypothetical protein
VAVLAYWHELMSTDPRILQDRIDAMTGSIHAPVLALFGRQPGAEERDRFALLPAAKVEAWSEAATSSTSPTPTASPSGSWPSSQPASKRPRGRQWRSTHRSEQRTYMHSADLQRPLR